MSRDDVIRMAKKAGFVCDEADFVFQKPGRVGIQLELERFDALVRADERERLYGKDIDTLLFEEHRLGFEKGSRSEREACYTIAKFNQSNHLEHLTADQIKARGETK
jgi:hypothetical protein